MVPPTRPLAALPPSKTSYPMIAAPPLEAGGDQDSETRPSPAVAVSPVGGLGFRIRACGACGA